MFYNDGGIWKLVGHMTSRLDNGFNFTGNFAVATKYYANWIKSVIVDYDTDMDGLPDWWETEHGVANPGDLSDSDSFTNYEEWLSDTDPNNENSFPRIISFNPIGDVTFASSTNRKYQVQYRIDLADTNEVWATELDWFDGENLETTKSVSTPSSNRFYRVRATLH